MADEYTRKDQRNLLIATSSAAIITPLMSTMMNLSLLSIGSDFGVGSHDQAYVNTMFLLGSVVCMVPAARIASIRGMKKVFIAGLVILLIACILSIMSPSFWFLIGMRFMIGFGSSMLAVTSMAMLTFVFPFQHRGRVLGLNTTFVYIGLSVGPTIGGILTDSFGWRSIFAFIFCIALISLVMISRFRKEVTATPDEPMDWKGASLWGCMIIALMFGVVNITAAWGQAMACAGTVLLIAVWYYLRKQENPVLNTKMFHNPAFTRACVAAFMNYGASYCITFFLSLYLQSIGEMTATQAGALMLFQPIMQVMLTMKMGSLSDRLADKRILPALGMGITGIGVAMYLFLGTTCSTPFVIAIMVVTGIGLGIFSAPNTSLMMSSVKPHLKGEASGVVAVVRQTGMMVSMALAMSAISMIMGSTDNLGPSTYDAFLDTIHMTFAVCTVMCIVGVVCSLKKTEAVE